MGGVFATPGSRPESKRGIRTAGVSHERARTAVTEIEWVVIKVNGHRPFGGLSLDPKLLADPILWPRFKGHQFIGSLRLGSSSLGLSDFFESPGD
jgi:hypothetical protein